MTNCESNEWEIKKFWPFEISSQDYHTSQHLLEIQFLKDAFENGFHPFMFGIGNFGATFKNRSAEIIHRGRKRWEIVLVGSENDPRLTALLSDFQYSAKAVLSWLKGGDPQQILDLIHSHLTPYPTNAKGFMLSGPTVEE